MYLRLERVRDRIAHHKLDALLISSLVNLRYLFGFTGSNAMALIAPDTSFFITDRRYTQQSRQQVQNAEIIIAKKDLISELKKITAIRPRVKLGFESMHLKVKDFMQLKKTLPQVKLMGSERIIEKIASVKDAEEVLRLGNLHPIAVTQLKAAVGLLRQASRRRSTDLRNPFLDQALVMLEAAHGELIEEGSESL